MIDFKNGKVFKLSGAADDAYSKLLEPMLLSSEGIIGCFKTVRDGVVFTNKRILIISVQGIGKKKDITSLPYRTIQAYSVETAGVFDMDGELELWFSGLGSVRFEFSTRVDMAAICKVISECSLC